MRIDPRADRLSTTGWLNTGASSPAHRSRAVRNLRNILHPFQDKMGGTGSVPPILCGVFQGCSSHSFFRARSTKQITRTIQSPTMAIHTPMAPRPKWRPSR